MAVTSPSIMCKIVDRHRFDRRDVHVKIDGIDHEGPKGRPL
jgi:hypothetical protein